MTSPFGMLATIIGVAICSYFIGSEYGASIGWAAFFAVGGITAISYWMVILSGDLKNYHREQKVLLNDISSYIRSIADNEHNHLVELRQLNQFFEFKKKSEDKVD